jgi:uncharacterized protein
MNRLKDSTSPYLLQHANNPVDWFPWGAEAFEKAKNENKPILLSIGYSSCHWCHVMAHESFENAQVAQLMNDHFVNIKLDREERPDIDSIYMDAVQAMGLRGGWPLNVFLLPDQRPFYGGTYFPKEGWKNLLGQIAHAFENHHRELEESAEQFRSALSQSEVEKYKLRNTDATFNLEALMQAFEKMGKRFDRDFGGMAKAPKFPMPCVWDFTAHIAALARHEDAKNHFLFTLDCMCAGGIYDQIGGGFARYSVDGEWHVPHFEKMLYDNGQLLSLYAIGYKLTKNPRYAEVILETAQWMQNEMFDSSGGFYSALDADSEGEEGKFYVWSLDEIKALEPEHFEIICTWFDISKKGNWESTNVLRQLYTEEQVGFQFNLSKERLHEVIASFKTKSLAKRNERIRPDLDSKIISGWNGLALRGLCEAYQATGNELLKELAIKNARYLKSVIDEGKLLRFPGQSLEGFLEDYATVIQSYVVYYETYFDFEHLQLAQQLTERTLSHFYDKQEGYFHFTGHDAEMLIARKKELFDNVIPASNSIMAWNLFHLGAHLFRNDYQQLARDMVQKLWPLIQQEPEYLSNWAALAVEMASPFAEVAVVGKDANTLAKEIQERYLPAKILAAFAKPEQHPLLLDRNVPEGNTLAFVCHDQVCQLPVATIKEVLAQLTN